MPVPADLEALARGPVERRDVEARVLGRRAGEQRLLEPVRDVALLLEQQRPVERERDLVRAGRGERALLDAERPRRVELEPQHRVHVRGADGEDGARRLERRSGGRRGCRTGLAERVQDAQAAGVAAEREPRARGAERAGQLGAGDPPDRAGVGRRREHRAEALQPLRALAHEPLAVARDDQLALVAPPVGGVEDRRADQARLALVVVLEHGVDERRHARAVGADDVHRDLAHGALHAQQRRVVRLVVEPPADAQEVLEAPQADELLAAVAGPLQERPVDADDQAVGVRRQVPARRVLVEVERALLDLLGVHRKSRIAAVVAAGALRFGQCPVASRITSSAPGMAAWTYAPDGRRGDRVLARLEHEGGDGDRAEVVPVVGQERHAREARGDLGVGPAEAVRQLLAELRPLGVAHDHGGHRARPAEEVALERVEQLVDVRAAEAAACSPRRRRSTATARRARAWRTAPARAPRRARRSSSSRSGRRTRRARGRARPAARARRSRSRPARRGAPGRRRRGPRRPRRRGRTGPPDGRARTRARRAARGAGRSRSRARRRSAGRPPAPRA